MSTTEFDRQEKIGAGTRLYNEMGIDRLAQEKIACYFDESRQCLDAVQVAADRKRELALYTEQMMKREY